MYCIVGLGNPGSKYASTRHNVGYMAVDAFAARHGINISRGRFSGIIGDGSVGGTKVICVKPETYMNLSGQCVSAVLGFYQLEPSRCIVLYDEADLPFEQLRIKVGGSSAGHRGIQNMLDLLSSPDFIRVRIGIGRPKTTGPLMDYVLAPFDDSEQKKLSEIFGEVASSVETILRDGAVATMNQQNRRTKATST